MPGNKVRFTKTQYDDAEDDDVIKRAHIASEQHAINHILRNLISNVEFIAILPTVLQLKVNSVINSELSSALQEHLMLEQRMEMLNDHKLVSDGKNDTTQLEKKIRSSFRNLLRLLKVHPLLLPAWKKDLGKEIGKFERALIEELNILGGLKPKPQLGSPKPVSSDSKDIDFEQDKDQTATMEDVIVMVRFMRKKGFNSSLSSVQLLSCN